MSESPIAAFPVLVTGADEAIVWAPVSDRAGGKAAREEPPLALSRWRNAALSMAWEAAGRPLLGHLHPPGTIRWLGAERLEPGARQAALAEMRLLPGEPLLSLEVEPHAAALLPWLAGLSELSDLDGLGEPGRQAPLWVHPILESAPEPGGRLWDDMAGLVSRGIPLAAEIRLLRGITGDAELLRALCRDLVRRQVRPQALVVGEWLPSRTRVSAEEALALVDRLRGWISGVAAPQAVREMADGRREACVPERIEAEGQTEPGEVAVRNYRGERYLYRDPPKKEG